MKKFYLSIFTIFTITQTQAADIDNNSQFSRESPTPISVREGGATSSEVGGALSEVASEDLETILRRNHTPYVRVKITRANAVDEIKKLMSAYCDLTRISEAKDAFVSKLANTLGETINPSAAVAVVENDSAAVAAEGNDLFVIQANAFKLIQMYNELASEREALRKEMEKARETTAQSEKIREAQLVALTKLENDLNEKDHKISTLVENMKLVNEETLKLRDENSHLKAKTTNTALQAKDAEIAKLQAENAALKAAARQPAPTARSTSNIGVNEPLLYSDSGARGKPSKEKEQGCSCVVM